MIEGLLCGHGFGSNNKAIDSHDAITAHKDGAWLHFDMNNPNTRTSIEALPINVPPLVVDALLAEETRPRLSQFEQGFVLNLRGVNLNDNADPEDMVSIRLWCDGKNIVTARIRRLKAVDDIRQSYAHNNGPKSASDFIITLSSSLILRMEPTIDKMDETIALIEEHFLEDQKMASGESLLTLRRRAVVLKRYMIPQRDALQLLHSDPTGVLATHHKQKLGEVLNRLSIYLENLDALKERAQIIKEEIAAHANELMNKNMYMLSIIAAIFLPLGFLTGLLGINIAGIPGAEYPYAFFVFSAMLVVIVISQILLFKYKNWL